MKPKDTSTRSDNLLPADEQVAEEVSLDQQSDQARRVGQAPADVGKKPTEVPDQDAGKPGQ
jgi:hypothetical protein